MCGILIRNFVTTRQTVQSLLLDHSVTVSHGLHVRYSILLTKECLNSIRMLACIQIVFIDRWALGYLTL